MALVYLDNQGHDTFGSMLLFGNQQCKTLVHFMTQLVIGYWEKLSGYLRQLMLQEKLYVVLLDVKMLLLP